MNRLIIVGNLTNEPSLRTTVSGKNVCSFTVAVNRRKKIENHPDADFFNVAAWGQLGENCAQFLNKGKKVCVVGSVSVHTYTGNDGVTKASLDLLANDVEFLTPKGNNGTHFTDVSNDIDDELPFN